MTPDFSWPCVFDDAGDCGWDYGPPTPPENGTDLVFPTGSRRPDPFEGNSTLRPLPINISKSERSDGYPYGRAEHQPPNVPPPVYVMGKPLTLHLEGPDVYAIPEDLDDLALADESDGIPVDDPLLASNLTDDGSSSVLKAITPDRCLGPIDTPSTLPTLTYFCEFLPNICANIRDHEDWPLADSMILTYDPFSASTGRRRRGVCTKAVKAQFQRAACDKQQHDPSFWPVSTLSRSLPCRSMTPLSFADILRRIPVQLGTRRWSSERRHFGRSHARTAVSGLTPDIDHQPPQPVEQSADTLEGRDQEEVSQVAAQTA